jgi:hypothetical protein
MPKAKIGNNDFDIPFIPELIARLIYNGIKVFPDSGADTKKEKELIDDSLRRLWGNETMRTIPGRSESVGQGGDMRWDDMKSGATSLESNYPQTVPNPFLYNIPEYKNTPQDRQEVNAGSFDTLSSLIGILG